MSASQIRDQVLKLPDLNDGILTILLGAGASASSGLPDWAGMVSNLLLNSEIARDFTSAQIASKTGDLVLLAESVHKQYDGDREGWLTALSSALYGNGLDAPKPSTMQLNAAFVACENIGKIHLATLNFDVLLDQAVTDASVELEDVLHLSEHKDRDKELKVEHLHGCIKYNGPADNETDPVFSFFDYLLQLESSNPSAKLYLTDAIKSGSLLIAGTSFRDPDMRQWLASILRDRGHENSRHKACILLARESYDGIDRAMFNVLKPILEAQWTALGFCPIFVEDFEDVAQLIREVPYVRSPGYLNPSKRIDKLWECLTDSRTFESQQKLFVCLLQKNKEAFEEITPSGSSVNATLWIAHGNSLVRLASHDRIYVRSDLLRANPIGFDSPYIAGQAYSSNMTKSVSGSSDQFGRWKTIAATPIVVFPDALSWYTSLPVGVISFGCDKEMPENPDLAKMLAGMALEWSTLFEELIEQDCSERNNLAEKGKRERRSENSSLYREGEQL